MQWASSFQNTYISWFQGDIPSSVRYRCLKIYPFSLLLVSGIHVLIARRDRQAFNHRCLSVIKENYAEITWHGSSVIWKLADCMHASMHFELIWNNFYFFIIFILTPSPLSLTHLRHLSRTTGLIPSEKITPDVSL